MLSIMLQSFVNNEHHCKFISIVAVLQMIFIVLLSVMLQFVVHLQEALAETHFFDMSGR